MTRHVALADVLVPALLDAFPSSGMRVGKPPGPVAMFPAACDGVGDVLIFDDGDEATVVVQNITHHHENPYDASLVGIERYEWITERVVAFLRELFADRILLWSRDAGRRGGGWVRLGANATDNGGPRDADVFVWSRRVETAP
jgi:hypothetical protein